MSNLSGFIQGILDKRQSRKPLLERLQGALSELGSQLDRLAELAAEATGHSETPEELRGKAAGLSGSIGNLRTQVTELQAKVANLMVRFGKNTITLGVAGKARQGKSTLLQKISGLDDAVIPTSDGLPCTGAKSKILHQEHDPHAVIEFYTEEEFLKGIVHAYYDDLHLHQTPASLSDFRRPLPPLDPDVPEKHAVYQRLQQLQSGLAEFSRYLSHRSGRIALERVSEFVSQGKGRNLYLAVKCANIYVRFPNRDATGLGIVDLPGLGEIALGHGQKLVASLQQEVDAVILIKLPGAEGAHWDKGDYEVFNCIKQAVPEIDLADWLFLVLNGTEQNAKQVELLKKHPPDVGSPLRILSANCRSADEVDQHVFTVVLDHLQKNLERIDQQFLTRLASQAAQLANDLEQAVRPVQEFFQTDQIGLKDELQFNNRCHEFILQLRVNLEKLVEMYRQKLPIAPSWIEGISWIDSIFGRVKRRPSEAAEPASDEFQKTVAEACAAAEKSPPVLSVDELRAGFYNRGGWKGVYEEQQHHLRSHLTHQLALAMDRRLVQAAGQAQQEIFNQLLDTPMARLLSVPAEPGTTPRSRIERLQRLLDPKEQPTLAAGFDYVLSYTFSYQSHFHYRVRKAMDPLDPMALTGQKDLPYKKVGDAEKICQDLTETYRQVVQGVREVLHGEIQYDSLRAIFAMIEETKDRLARAKPIEEEWRKFLYVHRGDLWPDAFSRYGLASARRQQWQTAVDDVLRSANELRSILPH